MICGSARRSTTAYPRSLSSAAIVAADEFGGRRFATMAPLVWASRDARRCRRVGTLGEKDARTTRQQGGADHGRGERPGGGGSQAVRRGSAQGGRHGHCRRERRRLCPRGPGGFRLVG